MSERCAHCSAVLGQNRVFCHHCGAAAGAELECENHLTERAIAVCVVCGKPVCGDCSGSAERKFVCSDHGHQEIVMHWRTIFAGTMGFEADMVARNLEQAGLHPRSFDWREFAAVRWPGGTPVAKVWVKGDDEEEAMRLLTSLHLLEEEDDENV